MIQLVRNSSGLIWVYSKDQNLVKAKFSLLYLEGDETKIEFKIQYYFITIFHRESSYI